MSLGVSTLASEAGVLLFACRRDSSKNLHVAGRPGSGLLTLRLSSSLLARVARDLTTLRLCEAGTGNQSAKKCGGRPLTGLYGPSPRNRPCLPQVKNPFLPFLPSS